MSRIPFTREAKVAEGGMGEIYRARDDRTGRLVALKLLHEADPETRHRFAREAEVLARLDHPAIVRYVAHGADADGTPFLAMEWLEGGTLKSRLEHEGVTVAEAVALARRLAEGLSHVHQHGIVHRDLKPANVVLRGGALEQATLVDFGVARVADAARRFTATGAVVGTPAYMSPEQARGDRSVDARSDTFALGCVLYECLTGRKAFAGRHALALIAKVVLWDPLPLSSIAPQIPPALGALVRRMIAKPPGQRPDDDTLIAELERLDLGVAAGAVRTLVTAAALPTHRIPAASPVTMVIATTIAGADGEGVRLSIVDLEARQRVVLAALGGREVRVEVLPDGSVLVLVSGASSPELAASLALACAQAIVAALPDLLVAITTGGVEIPAANDDVFEATIGLLVEEAMARIFKGPAVPGAIRVDAVIARHLGAARVVHRAGAIYALAEP